MSHLDNLSLQTEMEKERAAARRRLREVEAQLMDAQVRLRYFWPVEVPSPTHHLNMTLQEERSLALTQVAAIKVCGFCRPIAGAHQVSHRRTLVLQEELRRLERNHDRERNANLEYLKNIVLAYITSKDAVGR